ncbi:carboxypeptidase regulatory-like domain-containing protein [Actinacidiphila acididurans]|uniref:carboxypeptidase regulatory-like domain-containing protein n=1 Tax=Actinacidiphila acididurans TaxID=2784346 RepID=UPI0027DCAEE0|nr:carboxypeptidase regulatory-like domain-containing protein [Actinacidiphila acididurans]
MAAVGAALIALAGAAQAPAWAGTPQQAAAQPGQGKQQAQFERMCADPGPGKDSCFGLRKASPRVAADAVGTAPQGYGPADLLGAYNIPAGGGAGTTVAIVDAYDDPQAESDLAVYRAQYGLPACTTANGCFTKTDQRGGSSYPVPDSDWAGEISLDLDMVSALAPQAHILLVEADDSAPLSLAEAEDQAVALGADAVSNSYGTRYDLGPGESPDETTALDPHYHHPGVAIVASAGDYGYGVSYPAASPYVTSVGGTSLTRDATTARGWREQAWSLTGAGCSAYEPKPAFQTDSACANRTVADVSAVADPNTGVATYDSYGAGGGWGVAGGTSVSSPIIAGVYADAGKPVAGTDPNSYPYAATDSLNDVTTGADGSCTPSALCTAGQGYDGPTGLGTPDGLAAFRSGPVGHISGVVTGGATGRTPKPLAGVTVTAGSAHATTGTDGSYSLTVPTGTYDVTATLYGWTDGSATGVTVTEGGTVDEDFTLTQRPVSTLSGTVRDGSGHGWPLYARVTVDGLPGNGVWTDPYTGRYTVSLPQGQAYSLHVTSYYPGYQQLDRQVTVRNTDLTADLALKADPNTATAVGYSIRPQGTTQTFDTTGTPQGWTVTDAPGTTGGWEFDDPGHRGNQTGGSGGFAILDSDHFGIGKSQDSALISPVMDLSGFTNPELSYDDYYNGTFSGQHAEVDITADGGAHWDTLWQATSSSTLAAQHHVIPLTSYAGDPAVQVRFHMTATWGNWWSLDNVFVGARVPVPVPGGLMAGTVTDPNTGLGLDGATVSDAADSAETAQSAATPDDPAVGDGFYWLFTPHTGKRDYQLSMPRYTTLTAAEKVAADAVAHHDFALAAGQLTVTGGPLQRSVAWGQKTTADLTVKNSGGAPATFTVHEQLGSFTPAGQHATVSDAPRHLVRADKGTFTPLRTVAAAQAAKDGKDGKDTAPSAGAPTASAPEETVGDAWQPSADLPEALSDSEADTYQGTVYSYFGFGADLNLSKDLFAFQPQQGTWKQLASAPYAKGGAMHGFIDGKLYAAGGWDDDLQPDPRLEIYDPATDSWTAGPSAPLAYADAGTAVLDGKLYSVGGCTTATSCGTRDVLVYDPGLERWSQAAPYPLSTALVSCGAIRGKLYCAGGQSGAGVPYQDAFVYDPTSDAWTPVSSLPVGLGGSAYSVADGRLVVAGGATQDGAVITNAGYAYNPATDVWTPLPNAVHTTYQSAGAAGFYKLGGTSGTLAAVTTVEQLPGWDQQEPSDVDWLSESAQQVTLRPGQSRTITVTLDSSLPDFTQPGTYEASLLFTSDTPYAIPSVPVRLTVAQPAGWGQITGTVLGAGSSGTQPIAGATVEVYEAGGATHTLTTAADGTYALWLDSAGSPLTVIVAKDGYQPAFSTVTVVPGQTVTTDFTLKKV